MGGVRFFWFFCYFFTTSRIFRFEFWDVMWDIYFIIWVVFLWDNWWFVWCVCLCWMCLCGCCRRSSRARRFRRRNLFRRAFGSFLLMWDFWWLWVLNFLICGLDWCCWWSFLWMLLCNWGFERRAASRSVRKVFRSG